MRRSSNPRRASFVLLEAMLGVAIFAVGIIGLGKAVGNCLTAEAARRDDTRARMALENRMAEIEARAVLIDVPKTDELEGMFSGITLKQTAVPLDKKNEKNEPLTGLSQVTLEAAWRSGSQPQAKSLSFYVYRPR